MAPKKEGKDDAPGTAKDKDGSNRDSKDAAPGAKADAKASTAGPPTANNGNANDTTNGTNNKAEAQNGGPGNGAPAGKGSPRGGGGEANGGQKENGEEPPAAPSHGGLVAFWSLKNPGFPLWCVFGFRGILAPEEPWVSLVVHLCDTHMHELSRSVASKHLVPDPPRVTAHDFPPKVPWFETLSGVTALDFSTSAPNILALGLYSGAVAVYDVKQRQGTPSMESDAASGKHSDPVWKVRLCCLSCAETSVDKSGMSCKGAALALEEASRLELPAFCLGLHQK
eukprot:scaffold34203_cov18-Tisochrysis_lutea.AAC.1